MSKPLVNSMIKRMTLSGQTTKVSPWLMEGDEAVRYVGLRPDESWEMVLSPEDNLLCKFSIIDKVPRITIYLANKPPFVELLQKTISKQETWEQLIGKLKQRLKKEAAEAARGQATIVNLYRKIKPYLKR